MTIEEKAAAFANLELLLFRFHTGEDVAIRISPDQEKGIEVAVVEGWTHLHILSQSEKGRDAAESLASALKEAIDVPR